jgi:SAM-dependent methyltransferase
MNLKSLLKSIKPFADFVAVPLYMIRRIPHSLGYNTYKWNFIDKVISDKQILEKFKNKSIPTNFGISLDERVVEYPWIFSNINNTGQKVLDAGSTFNFESIVKHTFFVNKKLHIYTFFPELKNFPSNNVIYSYGDLRSMPYENNSFDIVVSHSTIEHIDMDNSIYGYNLKFNEDIQVQSYEYLKAVSEFERVLVKGGQLLMTFPFGKFKNYGFFQQFDLEMVNRIEEYLSTNGHFEVEYIMYTLNGWQFSNAEECKELLSFNPHTGDGRGNDNAAHCRGICCIKWRKY